MKNILQMSIDERIKSVMFFFRKSGTDLAKDLGITKSTITRTLKGETLPSSKLLIPLGEKLGVSIDWLLFGEGEMLREKKENAASSENGKKSKSSKVDAERIKSLEEQNKLLKQTISDKDEIIQLLKAKKG